MSKFDDRAILRPKDVAEYIGISRGKISRIHELDPTFPPKITISTRRVGWRKESIDAWLKAKEAEGM